MIIWDYGILFIFRDSLHGELTGFFDSPFLVDSGGEE